MITQEQAKQFLPLLFQMSSQLQIHSFNNVNGVMKHTKQCARCQGLYILNIPNDMEFSTDIVAK